MLAITQEQLDAVVREAYDHAHACCHYAPTDRSFPVGEDGKMDCTGLMLWWAGYVDRAMNCDEADQLMGDLGFVKSTDPETYTGITASCSGASRITWGLSTSTIRTTASAGMAGR